MKLIIAIIQPSHLEDVKEALTAVEVSRLTVMDCHGFGRQKGQSETYRGHDLAVNLIRKVQLQIAVNDEFVEATPSIIRLRKRILCPHERKRNDKAVAAAEGG